MARGQQKIQSQQKNAKKAAEKKKSQGADQKTAAKAALVHTCPVCRTQMPDPKTFKQHFETEPGYTMTTDSLLRHKKDVEENGSCQYSMGGYMEMHKRKRGS
ncbi:hypothetical protein AMECASPLE_029521 [Ameca splendens]|uniref:Small EDRK-rich factor-like N-terminal domain-containing protein n=1 Tax=Ameca splendens TaxID=208324 RepID=A0ABV1A199_9TELE